MFQSTRPCGARRPTTPDYGRRFQSTRPCGARRIRWDRRCVTMVSIHAPVRGATAIAVDRLLQVSVSIHAPVRGATALIGPRSHAPVGAIPIDCEFQSTRPCGARRRRCGAGSHAITVSIHAPVRGATRSCARVPSSSPRFNPRARAGRDRCSMSQSRAFGHVSIHAPVRGATSSGRVCSRISRFQSTRPCGARRLANASSRPADRFQSTRPCGARPEARRDPCTGRMFQSTRPCGARPSATGASDCSACMCFNPRARAGRDAVSRERVTNCTSDVSIHAPARGATELTTRICSRMVSIHAPVRGATRPSPWYTQRHVSIHAPARGATCVHVSTASRCFNPRARAGRDQLLSARRRMKIGFNPRARRGATMNVADFNSLLPFQSTRPTGATSRPLARWLTLRFNPRARTGRATCRR